MQQKGFRSFVYHHHAHAWIFVYDDDDAGLSISHMDWIMSCSVELLNYLVFCSCFLQRITSMLPGGDSSCIAHLVSECMLWVCIYELDPCRIFRFGSKKEMYLG